MLSIIIVNFKNPPLLRLCLKSLLKATKNLESEIIVIDSESEFETENMVSQEFKEVRFLGFKENVGYTKGVNEGLKNSKGDYFLILNPDIIPIEDSIAKIISFIKNNPDVGLVGPKLLNFDGSPQNSCFRFYKPKTILYRRTFLGKLPWAKKELDRFLMRDVDLTKTCQADWLMGSALALSRESFKKIGLLDENLFLYMSEVDWAKRFWENGYKVIYSPEAEMYHYHKRSSRAGFGVLDVLFRKESRWHLADAVRYFLKHGIKNNR